MLNNNNIDIKAQNSALIKFMNLFMHGESKQKFKNKLSDKEIKFLNDEVLEYTNFLYILKRIEHYNKYNDLEILYKDKINHNDIRDEDCDLRDLCRACEQDDINNIIYILNKINSFKTMLKAYKCLSYFKTYNFKIISLYLFLNLLSFNYEEIHNTKVKEFIELLKFFNELEIDKENFQLFSLLIKEINNKILKYLQNKYNNF